MWCRRSFKVVGETCVQKLKRCNVVFIHMRESAAPDEDAKRHGLNNKNKQNKITGIVQAGMMHYIIRENDIF